MMESNMINILGTEYRIETHKMSEDKYLKDNQFVGYCEKLKKIIVIADMSEDEYFADMDKEDKEIYRKQTLRHEITHAFLNESGLSANASTPQGAWAEHEEMIDWFAIQSPKMFEVFQELEIL